MTCRIGSQDVIPLTMSRSVLDFETTRQRGKRPPVARSRAPIYPRPADISSGGFPRSGSQSKEVRDMILGSGMESGAGIGYARLEDLVAELQWA
jgi:hypothetical protein